MFKELLPGLFLLVLSPAIGELLSTSSPPKEFFQPLSFFMLAILYGGGALLIRETLLYWNRGWLSLVLMGIAYGIAEEGLFCKSFFDPQWMDVGILGEYGRWIGVNWIWTVHLTAFHTVYSIIIPITVTHIFFPSRQYTQWLPWPVFWLLFLLWCMNGVVMALFFSYMPSILHYVICICFVLIFIWLAYICPKLNEGHEIPGILRIICNGIISLAGCLGGFLLPFLLPQAQVFGLGAIVVLFVWYGFFAWLLIGGKRRRYIHNPIIQSSMCAGAIVVLSLIAIGAEDDPARNDDPAGLTITGILFIVFCIIMVWRSAYRKKLKAKP